MDKDETCDDDTGGLYELGHSAQGGKERRRGECDVFDACVSTMSAIEDVKDRGGAR